VNIVIGVDSHKTNHAIVALDAHSGHRAWAYRYPVGPTRLPGQANAALNRRQVDPVSEGGGRTRAAWRRPHSSAAYLDDSYRDS